MALPSCRPPLPGAGVGETSFGMTCIEREGIVGIIKEKQRSEEGVNPQGDFRAIFVATSTI